MNSPRYRELLTALRRDFPTPGPDDEADARLVGLLVDSVQQALALRGLGSTLCGSNAAERGPPREARLDRESKAARAVVAELVDILRGLPLEVHPRGQVNVNVQPSTLSLVGSLLPAIFNPNMSSDGRGAGCSDTEQRIAALAAALIGYDPSRAAGVFTFGGTGTLLYGVKLGLEKACPDVLRRGLRDDVVVLASQRSHHTCLTAAAWLGIGSDHVLRVRVTDDNAVDVDELRRTAAIAIRSGRKIAAIVATVGTTDAFGLDDVASLAAVRDELVADFQLDYRPHLHADAVIGWAWAVFNDYDEALNPLGFSATTLQAMTTARPRIQALAQSDSLGIDFHKTGFVPYVSSLVLVPDASDFQRLVRQREQMPYLFHSGAYHPGLFTLETTRAAGGVLAAWANLQWLGRTGLQALLGHALEMTAHLREQLRRLPNVAILNDANVGPVTLYRVYPAGVDPQLMLRRESTDPAASELVRQHNEYNHRVHAAATTKLSTASGAAIGLTSAAGQSADGTPLVALKSYLLSPWLELADIAAIVWQVVDACRTT